MRLSVALAWLHAPRWLSSVARGRLAAARRGAVLAVASAVATVAGVAVADDEPGDAAASDAEARARQHFREGNQLFDRGLYDAALERFELAYGLWNNAKIKLNLATTLRAVGRDAEALQAYHAYLRDAQPSPERRAQVDAVCAELLERVASVRISVAAGVQAVWLDGLELAVPDPGPVYLAPGEHAIVSRGPGGERTLLEFEVRANERRELAIEATQPEPDRPLPSEPVDPAESALPGEPAPAGTSLALLARADIDGRGRGAVGALGLRYEFGPHWQVAGGGLIGRAPGVWAGVVLAPGAGRLQPTFGVSAPVFFAAGAHPGLSGEAGMRWAALPDSFFVSLRAAIVHFPGAPEGYSKTVFVPSLGSELQL
jgi:hypothetical protein